jgi:hypothetical protein
VFYQGAVYAFDELEIIRGQKNGHIDIFKIFGSEMFWKRVKLLLVNKLLSFPARQKSFCLNLF